MPVASFGGFRLASVAAEIDGVGRGFDQLDNRLATLSANAGEFAAKVAAQ